MAKKKKKKRPAQPGVDPNQKRQERLEQRRQERAAAEAARRKAARRERLVRAGLIVALIAAGVWFFFLRTQTPDAVAGHPIEKFSEAGTNNHTDQPVNYPMNPPVSGPHAQSFVPCGTYGQPVPNERLVHSLEHGTVAVLFDPGAVDQATVNAIERLVEDYDSRTLSAPFTGMETPFTVVSWGEMMRLDSFDEEAAREYIEAFRGKGPESVDCPNDASEHFEVGAEATPTPTPTETAGGNGGNNGGGGGNNNNGGGGNNNGGGGDGSNDG